MDGSCCQTASYGRVAALRINFQWVLQLRSQGSSKCLRGSFMYVQGNLLEGKEYQNREPSHRFTNKSNKLLQALSIELEPVMLIHFPSRNICQDSIFECARSIKPISSTAQWVSTVGYLRKLRTFIVGQGRTWNSKIWVHWGSQKGASKPKMPQCIVMPGVRVRHSWVGVAQRQNSREQVQVVEPSSLEIAALLVSVRCVGGGCGISSGNRIVIRGDVSEGNGIWEYVEHYAGLL